METFSSIPTITAVFANGVQCLWAVTECPVRRLDDPSVRSKIELTVIQQSCPSRLEFMVRTLHIIFFIIVIDNHNFIFCVSIISYFFYIF